MWGFDLEFIWIFDLRTFGMRGIAEILFGLGRWAAA
jgi:hypothetical protein